MTIVVVAAAVDMAAAVVVVAVTMTEVMEGKFHKAENLKFFILYYYRV